MVSNLTNGEIIYNEGFRKGLKLDPELTIDKWADEFRILTSTGSSEPGAFRTDRTPYMREIMECLSPSHPCESVVFQKAAQIGATEVGINWIFYVIDSAPGPFLMVQPTVDMSKKISKQRLGPAILETPCIFEKISPTRERDSGNTMLVKEFPGGVLMMTGANSAASLRSMPIRYLFLDEIDSYPSDLDGEGDPVSIARKRTATFSRRKVFLISTPTIKGFSRIELEYLRGDQRRYNVPCPDCGKHQVLLWKGIKFEHEKYKLVSEVEYACEHCGVLIPERHKTEMLAGGLWIPENQENGLFPSFNLNALNSPAGWVSWVDIVNGFLEFKEARSIPLQKTWTNTVINETFEEGGKEVDYKKLFNRRETYGEQISSDIVVITAGVDVQIDRIEVTVLGHALLEEISVLEHKVLLGDPMKLEIWKNLREFIDKTYIHEKGLMHISCVAIDSGYSTNEVYEFVKPLESRRVYAIKGRSGPGLPIAGKPTRQKNGAYLFILGVDTIKDTLYGRLEINEPGPGFIHFSYDLLEEYFKQLTAEAVKTTYRKGFAVREYIKKYQFNETLDCMNYGIAALYIIAFMSYPNNTVIQMLEILALQMGNIKPSEIKTMETIETQVSTPIPQAPVRKQRSRMINKGEVV